MAFYCCNEIVFKPKFREERIYPADFTPQSIKVKSGQGLKGRALLTVFPLPMARPTLFFCTSHSELGPPTFLIDEENAPTDMLTIW